MGDVLDAFGSGEPVIVDDDVGGTGGAVTVAGRHCDTATVAFLVKVSSGLLYVAVDERRADALGLPPQPGGNGARSSLAVSVDAREGVGTGISAHDRGATVRVLADTASVPEDLTRPGHVLPVRMSTDSAVPTGPGEAAYSLACMGGESVAAFASVVNDAGELADEAELGALARRHGLARVRVSDVVGMRQRGERVRPHGESFPLPATEGSFHAQRYGPDGEYVVVTYRGAGVGGDAPFDVGSSPVWLHEECFAGNVLGAADCGCRRRLDEVLAAIRAAGRGTLVYRRSGGDRCPGDVGGTSLPLTVVTDLIDELGTGRSEPAGAITSPLIAPA